MGSFGLYTHIQANRIRSVALLTGLFLLVYVMVFAGALIAEALSGDASLFWLLAKAWRDLVAALPWATVGTALWIGIAYRFHQVLIDVVTGGRAATRQEEPVLYDLLENLCISRGLAMPRLKVMESDALNAFATGVTARQYSVTVTRGLMRALDKPELEAVLGHELTHIRNGDVRLMVVAGIIAGVLGFFGELVFRTVFRSGLSWGSRRRGGGDDRKGSGGALPALLIGLALVAFAWFFSVALRLGLSRRRELLADAGSVELTRNPDAMASALRKIAGRGELVGATSAVMEMCVDNPREGFADLFATHPSIGSRIDALVRFAGARDPGPIASPEAAAGAPAGGPWGAPTDAPAESPAHFLPDRPPIGIGGGPWRPAPPSPGPWGQGRKS